MRVDAPLRVHWLRHAQVASHRGDVSVTPEGLRQVDALGQLFLLFSFSFRLSHHALADAASNGRWIQVGSLANRRVLHTATLLQDGRVLVAGGTSSGDSTTTVEPLIGNAELYDPTSKTWSTTGALNTLRRNNSHMFPFMVTLQNGKALIAGGSDANNNSISSAELYDPTTGTWSYTGSLNTPRRDMSMILLNDGRALIAAGTSGPDSSTSLASAELYDPTTGTWSYTANDLAVPRDGPTMVKLQDGRVLLLNNGNVLIRTGSPDAGTNPGTIPPVDEVYKS